MLKIKRKYLKPHRCPDCHKLVILVRYPNSQRCSACHKRHKRQTHPSPSMLRSNKYYNKKYKAMARRELEAHHFCALCGATKNLTCHHCVDVKTRQWRGQHLTVLCERCHQLWETKVNIVRSVCKEGRYE